MSSDLTDRAKRRRRILLSAVGAPAVLTLPNGAALAATSLTCVDRSSQRFAAGGISPVATAADGWVRAKVQKYSIVVNPTVSGKGFNYGGTWYLVQNGMPLRLVNAPMSHNEVNGKFYYVLVNYPDKSLVLTTGSGATPVNGASCWASVAGTAAPTSPSGNLIN